MLHNAKKSWAAKNAKYARKHKSASPSGERKKIKMQHNKNSTKKLKHSVFHITTITWEFYGRAPSQCQSHSYIARTLQFQSWCFTLYFVRFLIPSRFVFNPEFFVWNINNSGPASLPLHRLTDPPSFNTCARRKTIFFWMKSAQSRSVGMCESRQKPFWTAKFTFLYISINYQLCTTTSARSGFVRREIEIREYTQRR